MRAFLSFIVLGFLCSCASKSAEEPTVATIQIVDRNGTSETISTKERLKAYQRTDFLTTQPYQKVLRVYKRDNEGKSLSKITTYHSNGGIYQFLEVVDGRAHGTFKEWHENGKLKVEAVVIEGVADVNEKSQSTWLFDGKSSVWNEEGKLVAEIFYEKGMLESPSLYYHPNGQLEKRAPFHKNEIEGDLICWDAQGNVRETIPYEKGLRQGLAAGFWEGNKKWYEEEYNKGVLLNASYYNAEGELISSVKNGEGLQASFLNGGLRSLMEFKAGKPEGKVVLFDQKGRVNSVYRVKDEKKHGEEITYFQNETLPLRPRLSLLWNDGIVQGTVKTWYDNGQLESQREIHNNKKQGLSFAWYKGGEIMLVEEYENDHLIKGSYFKKGEKNPVSQVESGKGIATLFDSRGILLKKVSYEKGRPSLESSE